MTRRLVVGTRGSALARWQTDYIIRALLHLDPDLQIDILTIKTLGDRDQLRPLAELGGLGVFTKALEDALLDKSIDIAVHSLKDLPTESHPDLVIAATPERADPRDCIVSRDHLTLADLPQGAMVGTSSARRTAQLRSLRPDLQITPLRGNVDTRIRKVREGEYDAILLAAAGIVRLGREEEISGYLPLADLLPDPGQGALAVQIRSDDVETRALVAKLDHPLTRSAVTAERSFLSSLGGGCRMPIGAFAAISQDKLHLDGSVASLDGETVFRGNLHGDISDASEIGRSLAAHLLARGANRILQLAPFAGKRILVTRAREQAGTLSDHIRQLGGIPVELPTIDFAPVADFSELDRVLARVGDFDWIVFTSVNGVNAIVDRVKQLDLDSGLFKCPKLAAIGPATANALRDAGFEVSFVPSRYLGEQVAAELPIQPGEKALLLRADIASDILKTGLESRGIEVTNVTAYRTVLPELDNKGLEEFSAITLTSSSTARNLALVLQDRRHLIEETETFCIGPVTAATARELGFRVVRVASEHTIEGLVESMLGFYLDHARGLPAQKAVAGQQDMPKEKSS